MAWVTAKFKADHRGFERYATTSKDLRQVVNTVADEIKRAAAANTPRRDRGGATPEGAELHEQWKTKRGPNIAVGNDGFKNLRLTAEVFNNARHAAPIEFGTGVRPRREPRSPLRRAAIGIGIGDYKPGTGVDS